MSNDPLPSQIDVRKLTVKGAEISSNFSPAAMPRLTSLLANDEGSITAELQFFIDEGRKRRIDGKIAAHVNVVCQRCLEPVAIDVVTAFELAIVWTDEQAKQLPKNLDALIVGEELTDLVEVVEEELIICLPIVSYHENDSCKQVTRSFGEAETAPIKEEPKENPFKVLEQLRSDK